MTFLFLGRVVFRICFSICRWKTDHCELRTLSHFLETKIAWHRFKSLARRGSILQCHDRMQLYGQFLNSLNAYLLAPRNDTQLTVTRRPVSLDFGDCTQLRWSRLFTGKRRKKRLKVLGFRIHLWSPVFVPRRAVLCCAVKTPEFAPPSTVL